MKKPQSDRMQAATEKFALPIIDRYLGMPPEVTAQIVPYGSYTDIHSAIDAICGIYQIGIRVRDYKFQKYFYSDFTIRCKLPSGKPTEWQKICHPQSRITHGLYALWDKENPEDGFPCFVLYRTEPMRQLQAGIEAGGYYQVNPVDGVGYYEIPWKLFKDTDFAIATRSERPFPLLTTMGDSHDAK